MVMVGVRVGLAIFWLGISAVFSLEIRRRAYLFLRK